MAKKKNKLPDHIEEYFAEKEGSPESIKSRELFTADNQDIQFKTDLDEDDIARITTLHFNDQFLKKCGLKPIFKKYYIKFMKLRVSKDRKSREEFESINRGHQDTEQEISKLSNIKNIIDTKK